MDTKKEVKGKETFGDPLKLTDKDFSARAKRSVLRKDPKDTY